MPRIPNSTAIVLIVAATCVAAERPSLLDARPQWAATSALVGQAAPDERMDLRVHLRVRHRDAALAEAAALNDPDNPLYGHYLTTAEFRARYAPTPDDAAMVRAWLEAHGLTYDYASGNRMILAAHGSVAQMEAAFGTTIGTYRLGARTLRAPVSAPSVPAALSEVVAAVLGLHDDAGTMRPALARSRSIAREGAVSGGVARALIEDPPGIYKAPPPHGVRYPAECAQYWGATDYPDLPAFGTTTPTFAIPCPFTPPSLRKAYDLHERQRLDGSGVTVAVVEAFAPQPTVVADAQEYATRHDPSHPLRSDQLEIMMAPGADPPAPPAEREIQSWYPETALDIEAVHAVAPGAKILLVFTKTAPDTNPAVEALDYIVDNDLATIVSNSYADAEHYPGQDYAAFENVAIQANLKGVGLYFASGDHGDYSPPLAQSAFPASLPQVTAVGGTSLAIDRKGHRLFEIAWATTWSVLFDGTWTPAYPGIVTGVGGGGTSALYARPTYQEGVVPDAIAQRADGFGRVVPDVSLLANPYTGLLVGMTQTFPDGVYYDEFSVGGTSLASPLLAGLVALAEQKRGSRVGFINPALYKQRRRLVRDVVPSAVAPIVAPEFMNGADASGGIIHTGVTLDTELQTLRTTPGYDDTTGLGAPRVRAFIGRFGKKGKR